MRSKLPFLILGLAAWAGACSDDDGPSYAPPAESYQIALASGGSITIAQDTTVPIELTVTRGASQVMYPKNGVITVSAAGFPAETLHVAPGARVIWSNQSGSLHGIDFRNFPNNTGNTPTFPDMAAWTGGDSLRIMPNPGRDSLYVYRCNVSGHSADSGFIRVHMEPNVDFRSEDYTIANVNGDGLLTGVTPGTTNIVATVSGASVTIPVTVTAVPGTSIELSFLTVMDTTLRKKVDTIYAYPGDAQSSQLRAVIRAGDDTIYCNRCIDFHERRQRYVQFISRDTTKLLVRNAANPTRPDTAGRMLARDTTPGTNGVYVVLQTLDQQMKDSVLVHIKLRPIDSLEVRLDSFPDPLDPDDMDPYPSTNIVLNELIGLGVTFWARAYTPPSTQSPPNTPPTIRFIQVSETGTGRRPTLPIVTWETANSSYASITPTGHVTGLRWFTTAANLVLQCSDTTGRISSAFTGPRIVPSPHPLVVATRADSLQARYVIPGCGTGTTSSPLRVMNMPGVLCTSFQAGTVLADPNSVCTVWIRALATDPVTGLPLSDEIGITTRRPLGGT